MTGRHRQFVDPYEVGGASTNHSFAGVGFDAAVDDRLSMTVELDDGSREASDWIVDDRGRLDVVITTDGVTFVDVPPKG